MDLLQLKKKKYMTQNYSETKIIEPLINMLWLTSFAQVNKNRKAITQIG